MTKMPENMTRRPVPTIRAVATATGSTPATAVAIGATTVCGKQASTEVLHRRLDAASSAKMLRIDAGDNGGKGLANGKQQAHEGTLDDNQKIGDGTNGQEEHDDVGQAHENGGNAEDNLEVLGLGQKRRHQDAADSNCDHVHRANICGLSWVSRDGDQTGNKVAVLRDRSTEDKEHDKGDDPHVFVFEDDAQVLRHGLGILVALSARVGLAKCNPQDQADNDADGADDEAGVRVGKARTDRHCNRAAASSCA